MNITIRELSGPDINERFLDTLASLAEVHLTVAEAREIFRSQLRSGVRTYIAMIDDQIVGTATLLVEQKFIHRGGRIGHIEDVAVHRDFQKQGIGTVLVRHTTQEAAKFGCYKVILSCFPDRVDFYTRLGYRQYDVGMRLDLPRGETTDAAAAKLSSAATPIWMNSPCNYK
jgi:glucosamine-phosphate N-acetyltransferase